MHFPPTLSTITTTTSSLHCLAALQRADAFFSRIGVELDPPLSYQDGSLNYLKINRSAVQRASSERAQ
ncbi:hypothetical protein ACEPAG_4811 [Sanghuangporus baumii]